MKDVKFLAGSSHPKLSKAISGKLGIEITSVSLGKFGSGETRIEMKACVRDCLVFVLQTGHVETYDDLIELFMISRYCRENNARKIISIIPCFPQARLFEFISSYCEESISADSLLAQMMEKSGNFPLLNISGIDHLLTIDLQSASIEGYFGISTLNMCLNELYSEFIHENFKLRQKDTLIAGATVDEVKRAASFAKKVGFPTMLTLQNSNSHDVKDKTIVLVGNVLVGGNDSSVLKLAGDLRSKGAICIIAIITHAIIRSPSNFIKTLEKSDIDHLIITDTLPLDSTLKKSPKIHEISVVQVLVKEIKAFL